MFKPDQNYKFLEKPTPPKLQNPADGAKYLRYMKPNTEKLVFENGQYMYPRDHWPPMIDERVKDLKSRYGFTWRGITRPHDRELGIAGGEVHRFDLQTNEVLAVRRGYLRVVERLGRRVEEFGGLAGKMSFSQCQVLSATFIHKVSNLNRV